MFEQLRNRVTEIYGGLNEREQLLVKIAGVVLPLIALVFIAILFNQSLNSVRTDIDRYEQTINKLGDIAPKYKARQKSGKQEQPKKFSRKAIKDNDIDLTSFVATHATAVGVQVDTYDQNRRPLGSDDEDEEGASLYKLKVNATIRGTTIDKFRKLMERIEQSDKPVVIERIKISKKDRDKAEVRADLIVTTFKRNAKG